MAHLSNFVGTFTRRRNLSMSMLLAGVFFLAFVLQPQSAAQAATPVTPTTPTGQGYLNPPHLTAAQIAFGNAKQVLAKEYTGMLQGKESLAVYEQHMTLFMQTYHLGNIGRLHAVLTSGLKNKARTAAFGPLGVSPSSCPSGVTNGGTRPNLLCRYPTGAAQFPEEHRNYCANATVSTALVEDSFRWGSTILTNGGTTLSYNPYITTQSPSTALSDEQLLTSSTYLSDPYNPVTGNGPGAGPAQVLATLNDFVRGKGGQYSTVWYGNVPGNFQNDLISDINQGWDLAGGLNITGNPWDATLDGYPRYLPFEHWIPITYFDNGGATTYYADPTYAAPDYTAAKGWTTPGPYASTPTSNMIAILQRMWYIW